MWSRRGILVSVAALVATALTCAKSPMRAGGPQTEWLRLEPVDRFTFQSPESMRGALSPEELSGITWLEKDEYLAIGDEHATLHRLEIRLDPSSGKVLSVRFGAPLPLRDASGVPIPDSIGSDREGIALDRKRREVWISNEHTGADPSRSTIARHRLKDGLMTALVRTDTPGMMHVFASQRLNGGLESLTRRPDGKEFWTANEMPLTIDGEAATESTGGVVRLQKLDRKMRPVAQYPYLIDPYRARIASPPLFAGFAINGLSELLLLPGGALLALERSFAGDSLGVANLRVRIYAVDVNGATDLSGTGWAEGLRGRIFTPARKRLLWEENLGLSASNFEGMTLGPALSGGERPLLLIADNNGGRDQAIYSLRLSGLNH